MVWAATGQHQIQVHFPYMFLREAGKAVTTVGIAPGQVVRLEYRAPGMVFLPGKLSPAA